MILPRGLKAPLFAAFLMAAAGCDQTLEPFRNSDEVYFSVYGVLNASADRQWIRVTPIRKTITNSSEPLGLQVAMQHLRNGDMIVMRDSVVRFASPTHGSGGELFAHNFWTDRSLEPGETYRFTATAPNGRTASADVKVPQEIPEVVVGISLNQHNGYVRFPSEHVAMVRAVHRGQLRISEDELAVRLPHPEAIAPGMPTC